MQCDRCAGERFTKAGRDRQGRQIHRCVACGRRITARSSSAFRGYRFPDDIIALAVRWYLRYRLSYADIAEWLAERGIQVDPSTVYDWVRAFTPHFITAAHAHRSPISQRWRVDETYIKIGKRWYDLFRAIDKHGQIIDVYLSAQRNMAAAKGFFEAAMDASPVPPTRVTTDKATCYPPALRTLLPSAEHRTSNYVNNGLERDHQQLKGRIWSMRRFKTTASARNFCRGHTLIRNLGRGFSALTAAVSPRQRLVTAWSTLTASL